MNRDDLVFDEMDSPIGRLRLIADDTGLRRVCFERDRHPRDEDTRGRQDPSRLAPAREQLEQYFAGERRDFDLALNPMGTAFQRGVWSALRDIYYGVTISYSELAHRIGNPGASRAVGAANGRNPLPIIVPCHRVVGRDGQLVGFGGGLETKAALLALESRPRPERRSGTIERRV
jgi:methylated-DNA-[protein]-cysteine S-methyltransferase